MSAKTKADPEYKPMEAGERPLPVPKPAANKRSPNRSPRTRSRNLEYLADASRDLFLKHYRLNGDFKRSCEESGQNLFTVRLWMREHPEFSALVGDINEMWQEIHGGEIRNLQSQAIKQVARLLAEPEKDRPDIPDKLIFEAAKLILKGTDLLKEGSKTVVHTGPGGGAREVIREIQIIRDPQAREALPPGGE